MPTILVTGAGRGLGLEFVRQYAGAGWQVLGVVRDPLKGKAASEAGAKVYVADMADPSSIARLKAALDGVAIDILLNNAGIYGGAQEFGRVDSQAFLEVVRVNALGPLMMAEAFADSLTGPKIIASVSSMMGSIEDNSSGGYYAYRAGKAALNMVTKSLAVDLKPRGITAVALSPGWVKTDMGGPSAPLEPPESVAGMRRVLDGLDIGRTGRFFHYDGCEVPW